MMKGCVLMRAEQQGHRRESVGEPCAMSGLIMAIRACEEQTAVKSPGAVLWQPWLGLQTGVWLCPTSLWAVPAPYFLGVCSERHRHGWLALSSSTAITKPDFLESSYRGIEKTRLTSVYILAIFACLTHVYIAIIGVKSKTVAMTRHVLFPWMGAKNL